MQVLPAVLPVVADGSLHPGCPLMSKGTTSLASTNSSRKIQAALVVTVFRSTDTQGEGSAGVQKQIYRT